MSNEQIEFTDQEIEKIIGEFDNPIKLQQFYYMLQILADDNIKEEDEIDFEDYINKHTVPPDDEEPNELTLKE